jgi:hypothetical protein
LTLQMKQARAPAEQTAKKYVKAVKALAGIE